ncbi:MAG: AsmA family protein, partial [Pseudomonadaceae bacterium]
TAMSSEWSIAEGMAKAEDVAMRTEKSRVALAGELDFVEYAFADLRVAVIDVDGCAVIQQRINGRFKDPEVESPNVLVEAIGPVLDLVDRGLRALDVDDDCEVFYDGSIEHPQ